jgi:Sec-independent protein secretion pathway component TatC
VVIGPPISVVGFGLLYTVDQYTSNAKLIGFQILAGFGIGAAFQMPLIAIQGTSSPAHR